MNLYEKLLKKFADALIATQINNVDKTLNGGFLCRCCKNIHGRSIDAIYALGICYKKYKDEKYLNALIKLFEYSDNVLCTDGGLYNDLQTEWRFTTTFFEIALVETYNSCKDVLPSELINKMKDRIAIHAKWLYDNLDECSAANINYCTTNALSLLLAGTVLNNNQYIERAFRLARYALNHISKNNLFYGEWQPHDKKSDHGCYGIDIGYNLEESLPALAKFAYISKDDEIYEAVKKLGIGHLDFILPDGAIDNSFGDRNYKWTYYGSRTCDGIISLCLILGKEDPRFIEASYRNLELIDQCSPNGYLYGGPDYKKHNENPCLHHTFEHINEIAFAIEHFDEKYLVKPNVKLPSEEIFDKYYEEMDAYRISNNKFILDISNYDVNIPYNGHLCGGTITLLFNKLTKKPYITGSVGDYQLTEQTNMQVPLNRDKHRPIYPRIEIKKGKDVFTTGYYLNAKINKLNNRFSFDSALANRNGILFDDSKYHFDIILNENDLEIKIKCDKKFEYILPLINGELEIGAGKLIKKEEIFFLTPGFIADEYIIQSENNEIVLKIK